MSSSLRALMTSGMDVAMLFMSSAREFNLNCCLQSAICRLNHFRVIICKVLRLLGRVLVDGRCWRCGEN